MSARGDLAPPPDVPSLRGLWFGDAREARRALRASWHAEAGCVVLSTWRGDACVGTVRLAPGEAARLAESLAAAVGPADAANGDVETA
jgi:hypothetical protein